LPKTNSFVSRLPPDPEYPTPLKSHQAPRKTLGPRLVKGALYTFVRPEPIEEPELLATSATALQDLGISKDDAGTKEFRDAVSGNDIISWTEENPESGVYPWAQCYGGYQFGQWAGQLGDGRAISLFEVTNPQTQRRYELQLKGAGKTPYSRFADGKAVLRSSIREFVVSEYLNALGIPTTRALSLVLAPHSKVVRERLEPGAVVARFAQSWIRIGTFDLLRARGDRKLTRQLAEYVAEEVYGGWDKLPAAFAAAEEGKEDTTDYTNVSTGVARDIIEHEGKQAQNRFTRLYRAIARANAKTVAAWQAYGFMNGVLNTDNTSIAGLSIDFGPFAFMDTFDPTYTPNHDDHMLRYAYRAQPSIIWWNLVRLGEALGELIGAGSWCDEEEFAEKGIQEERAEELVSRAENLIERTGEEYKAVFMAEYRRLMTARLGLKTFRQSDFDDLYSELLDSMEDIGLDFNNVFRRLSAVKMEDLEREEGRKYVAFQLWPKAGIQKTEADAEGRVSKWLEKWRTRVLEDWGDDHGEPRMQAMKSVNPKVLAVA
jgi:serine/tyrosine/threonine adenylyltransferase